MADTIYVQQGKLVVDTSIVPYIRRQDVAFDADNLRPGKIARLFFDEIVMNNFAQKANKILLNSKKIIVVDANNASMYTHDTVYQGPSVAGATFTGRVDTYYSANTTLVIDTMVGNFDTSAVLYNQNVLTTTTTTSANIVSYLNSNTADIFSRNEGVYSQNTNTYMEVVGTSGENILYVNENFVTINVDCMTGNTLSTFTSHYQVGDVVYQTPQGNTDPTLSTFMGRVCYYNPAAGANSLAISVIAGVLNVNTSVSNSNSRIWNASNSSAKALQAVDVYLNDIGANNVLISTTNAAAKVTVSSHVHNSGSVSNVRASAVEGGGQYLYINSSNASTAVGNLIYFTAGTGIGQLKRVIAVSGKRLTLNSALDVAPTHTTKYSIGNHIVDDNGSIAGVLNIPEEPNFKFRTGERIFTITDADSLTSSDFTMKASGRFIASGLLNKTQRIITTPIGQPLPEYNLDNPVVPINPTDRTFSSVAAQNPVTGSTTSTIPRVPLADGLSQTFFTPKPTTNKVGYGMFVSSVDLFFKNKPSVANGSLQFPITVKIAEVVNGFPTKNYIASCTVKAKDVKISDAPSTSNTSTSTKFRFSDPVYLLPDSEYAIVVNSESPEYELYIAELGGDVLGADPPRRISEQPYAGSLFRSQNSSTWTPYQNEDLMFVVNKAVFSSSGTATFNLTDSPLYTQNVDALFIHNNELTFPTGILDYKVKGIFKANLAQESTFNYVKPHQKFSYGDLLDASNKTTSANFLNSRVIRMGNANSIIVQAEFASSDPDISPIVNKESFSLATIEHLINNAGLSNTVISITNRGLGYNAVLTAAQHTSANAIVFGSANTTLNNAAQLYRETYLANNFNIGFYAITISGGEGTGANGFAVANTDASNLVNYIVITDSGSGYVTNPTMTIATGNATSNLAAAATIIGETGKSGGNIKAKYITRQITLEDGFESGDLRVFMDVVRPTGTDIEVYYKVLSADDPDRFSDKNWVRMFKKVDRKSKNNKTIVELEYHPSLTENKLYYIENGVNYPLGGKFKYFAVKVGLLSADPSVTPIVRNLRIIATPEG